MMWITDARERRVALVLRLSDAVTGDTIVGGRDISVVSGDGLLSAIAKPDGYFVFTDRLPDRVCVTSKAYCDAVISTDEHNGGVLRFALIPRMTSGRTVTVPHGAYIGFGGKGFGYALASGLTEESKEISLQKEDFRDITYLYHTVVTPDGPAETVYLEKNLGAGRYSLLAPLERAYRVRGTRLVALYRTPGGTVPVPPDADTVYIMTDRILKAESLEGL